MDDLAEQSLCDYEADRQTREVYRYFQPANPAAVNATWLPGDHLTSTSGLSTGTSSVNLDDDVSETASVEASRLYSPNTTLTSLAQLAALRLNAQRAFVTILNRDSQFVLAEATKTTNVGSSTLYGEEGDNLFAGTSRLSNPWNICQETVKIESGERQDGTYPFLIINDLERDERFRQLPFVQGEPHSRFYAGTPLTSNSNINLGCLFILDSEPREGLNDIEKNILSTVAGTVMNYLQVSRQAVEGHRASRLSQGLRLFVDGNSSFADNVPSSRSLSLDSSTPSHVMPYRRASRSENSQNVGSNIRAAQSENDNIPLQDRGAPRCASPNLTEESRFGMSASPSPSSQSSRQGDSSSMISSNTDWLFQRAANLLRQSLDLDGAGGVLLLEVGDDSSGHGAQSHSPSVDSKAFGPVLALSTREDPFSYQTDSEISHPAAKLDSAFLSRLCRCYPKGRLWSFHPDGSLSTSDEEQSVGASRKYYQTSRALEASKLNAYFPDASQVMFVPLWNATTLQWFAGCFSWTPQPTRVFSRAVDLSSMFGFASSIMAEFSRVESVISDRQKGDFISSISHELRSPLHGFLAAAEFLGGTDLDEFQKSLLETVNACGRTLLDTMNQVLDFSKILSLERQKKRSRRRKDPCKPKPPDEISARMDPLVSTNIAILTEEVVDSMCLGHSRIRKTATPSTGDNQVDTEPDVEVIVHISDNDWFYNVQPGSLRRLIMNLLGNALKYTEKGMVSVTIQATENSKGRARRQGLEDILTLTISDTGKGISKEFLQKRLYTPFAQEDTLSVGTGLGLSIVRRIVRTLNGNITIQSRVGEGTTVKVTLPLERPVGEKSLSSTPHVKPRVKNLGQETLPAFSQLLQLGFTGKHAAIWGIEPRHLGEYHFWSSIAHYITDWYGLKLVPWSADEHIDILLADESDLSAEEFQSLHTALPSILIFCSDISNLSGIRKQWSHLADSLVIIRRPCGPEKLARGILNCLDPKSAFLTMYSDSTETAFVSSERPMPSSPSPSTGNSKSPSSVSLEPSPIGSSTFMPGSGGCVMNLPKRKGAGQSPDTEGSSLLTFEGASSSLHAPSSSVYTSSSSSTAPIDSSGTECKPRVLLVDDNDINLRLIWTFMKKRNVTAVDTAQNGREAVDLVEKMLPGYDLVFMDMSMPVMDGFKATRAIRAIEKERNGCVPAKIIAFTGLSSLCDESRALESGVDVFLTKPVAFKEVLRLLEDWEIELSK